MSGGVGTEADRRAGRKGWLESHPALHRTTYLDASLASLIARPEGSFSKGKKRKRNPIPSEN